MQECMRNGKGVIVYPNPLVADLLASGIADRMAYLQDHRVAPSAEIVDALSRLERELDALAVQVRASIRLLDAPAIELPARLA